ncbi:hypothetical protein B0H13DRAFT_1995175 [Mycena leptocephala]|nr:hypothetical protein B0H13DRAFT_1995175 [Mycena leptocephala]
MSSATSTTEREPSFPPELERKLFETCALLHPETIHSLLLIAHRVLAWIEPILYRVLSITDRPEDPTIPLLATFRSKPPSFFHDHVRHLFVNDGWRIAETTAIFSRCTEVHSLAFIRGTRLLLDPLCTMRPRRLAVSLTNLFNGAADFTLPCFANLTHLDSFDTSSAIMMLPPSQLGALPSFTHFAMHGLPAGLLLAVLIGCPRLEVVVNLYGRPGDEVAFRGTSLADVRYVSMVVPDYEWDWRSGVRGGSDFWSRADMFVAKKKRGEIEPSSRHWIEPEDGI